MKSSRGAGGTFTFVQVENEVDLTYIKGILSDLRDRTDGQSFMEKRALFVQSSQYSNLEEEIGLAYEEITNLEKELKTLLSTTEILIENQEDLVSKLDKETQKVEQT